MEGEGQDPGAKILAVTLGTSTNH